MDFNAVIYRFTEQYASGFFIEIRFFKCLNRLSQIIGSFKPFCA